MRRFAATAGLLLMAASPAAAMTLESHDFEPGTTIPTEYTCDGENTSPALSWSDLPEGTKSLALIVEDPDAPGGVWVHWVVYNVPAERGGLGRGEKAGTEAGTSFGKAGYGGPCPPEGDIGHRYFFRLYALDVLMPEVRDAAALKKAMKDHVLAQAETMGRYAR